MGRLIDADSLKEKFGACMFKGDTIRSIIDEQYTVEAIPKDQYEARLTELRSMALRVKHNTGNIDTLIDKLDDLLSEVQK